MTFGYTLPYTEEEIRLMDEACMRSNAYWDRIDEEDGFTEENINKYYQWNPDIEDWERKPTPV